MRIDKDPFVLGVASGDPLPDSVVLWTRLAPEPLEPGSGLPAEPVTVRWETALDAEFTSPVGSGEVTALPEAHHSVHVEAAGLTPATTYYYRFRLTGESGEWTSPAGRTRTAPAADSDPSGLRFGIVACQAYHHGYFTPLRHLAAEEDLTAVLCLGDWLYEYAVDAQGGWREDPDLGLPARLNKEAVTLEDYRLRYSLYRTDPDLRAAHHAHPWIVTWDDHEVQNNYAADTPVDGSSKERFLLRRAAAYQAYYENMPLRPAQAPSGPDLTLYRRFRFGSLARLDVLDERQYRDDQSNGDGWKVPTDETNAIERTMLGTAQEEWYAQGATGPAVRWNVVAQGVVLSRRHNRLTAPYPRSMDSWDGYPAARKRLLEAARSVPAGSPDAPAAALLVLSGDVHLNYGLDIKEDFDEPASATLGVELVTTSVSSDGNGADRPGNWDVFMKANPHLRYYNGRRGYLLVTLDRERLRADFRTVAGVSTPTAPVTTAASFTSAAGDPGLTPA